MWRIVLNYLTIKKQLGSYPRWRGFVIRAKTDKVVEVVILLYF